LYLPSSASFAPVYGHVAVVSMIPPRTIYMARLSTTRRCAGSKYLTIQELRLNVTIGLSLRGL